MVVAAAETASLGFLPAGYKTAVDLSNQIAEVRRSTSMFGVNLFVPNPVRIEPDQFRRYARTIQGEADDYGLDLTGLLPVDDEDDWSAKVDLLIRDPVPVVSFTFGLPDRRTVEALRRAGSTLVQTVTTVGEAMLAADSGMDALAVQSAAAGGHYGTFAPERPTPAVRLPDLVGEVRDAVKLPLIGAGGIADSQDVASVIRRGAEAAAVGTLLLLTPESGANATYRAALEDKRQVSTAVTRAFTGRPARAIRNTFLDRYSNIAPFGYPALHHLTAGLRRAAAAAGDQERLHLWAGTGHHMVQAESTATVLTGLAQAL
jgi:NAD(P)H-dependent flavin oxidoreductase YrpB (nitropropane dioxygenase family)